MTDQRMRLIAYVTIAGEVVQVDDVGTNTFQHHYVHAPEKVRFMVVESGRRPHIPEFLAIDMWDAVVRRKPGGGMEEAAVEGSPSFPDPAAAIMSAVLKALDHG